MVAQGENICLVCKRPQVQSPAASPATQGVPNAPHLFPLNPGPPRQLQRLVGQRGCVPGPHGTSLSFQVFDSSGSFLSYINTTADPLYGPQGLALTSDGHVVVADSGNHCFKAYRYLQ